MIKARIAKSCAMLAWALIALSATTASASAAQPRGAYDVVRLVDLDDQTHAQYRENDPRLLGRVVVFRPGMASIDFGHGICRNLHGSATLTTPGKVVAQAAAPARRPDEHISTYASLGLPGRADRVVSALRYRCDDGSAEKGSEGADWNGASAFPVDASRWALTVYSQVLLIIAPQQPGPAKPSFACGRATTTSERAICSDRTLAGWDRSVAAAYRLAVAVAGDPQRLGNEQNAWIADRNACADDISCLTDKMRARVDQLMQQQ